MLSRTDVVAIAMVAGMGLAAPLGAQTVFTENVVIDKPFGTTLSFHDPGSIQGPMVNWTFAATLASLSVQRSAAPVGTPNPPVSTPFIIAGGAPNSLLVLGSGGIGSGIGTPQASFHVVRSDSSAQIRIEESNRLIQSRNLLRLLNNGPSTLRLEDKVTGQFWAFGALSNGNFFVGSTPGLNQGFMLSTTGDVTIGGTLTQGSDRNSKQAIEPVNGAALLERVARLPLATWEYKDAAGVRHLGPMAQDFVAEFGLGADDKHIAPGDAAGVSLAAIQALKSENDALRSRLAAIEAQVTSLAAR
jgi:hypothetical protein